MNINLKVPDDMNDRRQALGVTWRELLLTGITTLEGTPLKESVPIKETPVDRTAIEAQLMILVQGSKAQHDAVAEVWKLIKPLLDK